MKKLTTALMVVALLGGIQQKALAWKKCEFSIGMSFSIEKANTSCLWGMFKSGPGPCQPLPPEHVMEPIFDHGGFGHSGYAAAFGVPGVKAPTAVASNPAPAYGHGYGYPAPAAVAWNYAPAYGYGYYGYAAPAAMAWMPIPAYGYGYPAYPTPAAVASKPAPAPAAPSATQPVGYYPNYNAAYGYPASYYYYPQWTGYAGW